MKGLKAIIVLLAAVIFLDSCDIYEFKPKGSREKKLDKVLILYQAGFNSLSGDLLGDIEELKQGDIPAQGDDKVIVVVNHRTTAYRNYGIKTQPCVMRLYKDKKDQTILDTLTRLGEEELLTKKEVMAKCLNYIADNFKADHYGLILESHGTGWLPAGYYANPDKYKLSTAGGRQKTAPRVLFPEGPVPFVEPEPMPGPRVRTFGEEIRTEGSDKFSYEMDIKDLPSALPFHFDYILMDVCLMGCIEVAYEMKDCCDYLGFSPAEILSDGLRYAKMASRLLKNGDPDLKGVLDDYYDCYAAQQGDYQSACFTLVDCRQLEPLAQACKAAFETHRESISKVKPSTVQPLFRSSHHWFYDLEDIVAKAGGETGAIRLALEKCVAYEVHTESFMPRSGGFHFKTYCGFSMYLPCNGSAYLDEFYKTLAWNKATSLVL
ncbi:MAG: hypothetical protein IJU69_03995 [Bacteroidales bacterium]|nr:hypothetical protein [Bacteroidales bacterium]